MTKAACLACDTPADRQAITRENAPPCVACGSTCFLLFFDSFEAARARMAASAAHLDVSWILAELVRDARAPVTPPGGSGAAPTPMENPPLEAPRARASRPETIRVRDGARFNIRLDRLLESSPVVVEDDGVYTIDLPGAFRHRKA